MEKRIIRWSQSSSFGSWNRQHINAVMHSRTLSEVRIAVFDKTKGLYEDNFTWVGMSGNPSIDYWDYKGVYKTDYHSVSGDYSKIGLYFKDFKFELEFAAEGEKFIYKITPVVLHEGYDFFVGFLSEAQKGNKNENIVMKEMGCSFNTKEGNISIEVEGEQSLCSITSPYLGVLLKGKACAYIKGNNNLNTKEAEELINRKRKEYMSSRVYGEGFLGEGVVEAIIKGTAWNKVYDNANKTFKTDVTRLWAPDSCYYTFYWDNFFASLLFGLEDEKMAYDQVDSVCSEFKDEGYLPQCAFEWGGSSMINPPIGSFCLLKLYRQYGDITLLEAYFDRLYSTNTYLLQNKSIKRDGILQLRQDHTGAEENTFNEILGTGLDNSPMYDNAKQVNMNDIGISSIFALDCRMLGIIAELLERREERAILIDRYEKVKEAINETMWDEVSGIYCNTTIEGKFLSVYSPTSFYPMLAEIATKERAERMIREHLLNEREFWGEYVIPSISKENSAYEDQNYWRGCAWAPMNYLVYQGLKNYDYNNVSHELAIKSLNMFRKNWVDHGWILENYNTITGGITKNCVPMYTWGGLMAFMGVEEIFDANPVKGIILGSLCGDLGEIKNLKIGDDLYDISSGKELRIFCNGELLVEVDAPAIISRFYLSEAMLSFGIEAADSCNCSIYLMDRKVEVTTKGEIVVQQCKSLLG